MASAAGDVSRVIERAWLSRGPVAIALLPLTVLYWLVTRLRRGLYRIGVMHSHRIDVPVIVVGNLIAGGAGKTPAVIAVARLLIRHGMQPGIVSRGHGRRGTEVIEVQPDSSARDCGDEPLLLRLRLGIPVVVGRDRVAAARALRDAHPEVDVIVADDGLQHLRLQPDASVVVFDERGAGNGWLLPSGPLREPLPARLPPRCVVLYNARQASTPLPGFLGSRALGGALSLHEWRRGGRASPQTLRSLVGRRVVAAAGIANPRRFFDMLQGAGLTIDALTLPDHFAYGNLPWSAAEGDVIVTEKDAVKLDSRRLGQTRVWVAPLDFSVEAGFETALLDALAAARSDRSDRTRGGAAD